MNYMKINFINKMNSFSKKYDNKKQLKIESIPMHIKNKQSQIKHSNIVNIKNEAINPLVYKDLTKKVTMNKNTFYSSSSSVIKNPLNNEEYIINTRMVNYKMDIWGKYYPNIYDPNINIFSINKISILNKNFEEVKYKYILPDFRKNIKYNGMEDLRIFNFNNILYFICSLYNVNNKCTEMCYNTFSLKNNSAHIYNPIALTPTFKTDYIWEKNWVFFNNNGELNIIYKWSPIYICKIDVSNNELNLIKSIDNIPDVFNKFRGSTNGVFYNNKFWFIIHETEINGLERSYFHRFVIFNKNMNLLGYSNRFKFENKTHEFCIGMDITCDNNFIITYSVLDCFSKLIVLSPSAIILTLSNIDSINFERT